MSKFQKGQSGNPGGRPKESDDVKELARAHGADAIKRLVEWMKSDNPKASVSASQALLDRGFGKPLQAIEHTGDIEHNYVARIPGISRNMDEWQNQHGDPLKNSTLQ